MNSLGHVMELSARDFNIVQRIVYEKIGIDLTEAKKALVVSRLSKRLRELKLNTFTQYYRYLQESPGETEIMFNCLTTNVTRFFREQHHFESLYLECLPRWEAEIGDNFHKRKVRAWSAGCSTGEEPYTLAMVLHDYFQGKKGWSINILASDVNTDVLEKARRGLYSHKEIEGIPYSYLKKYFKLGTGSNQGFFKTKRMLQELVAFRRINLASAEKYPAAGSLDLIFCRNVFIYFDREVRRQILERFHRCLQPGGLLFLGHSESINTLGGQNGRWHMLRHTIYQRIP
ncbi:MAG: protein-glutamate O-methyltransferase CheR [Firmicutes bacterium]|nr:protein-glutamate O-methyltransferase CheR [Bacillota bacterium]